MSDKLGLVGRKIGMTRIFQDDGKSVPVTVLDVSGNRVTRVKTVETTATMQSKSRSARKSPRASTRLLPVNSPRLALKPLPC